MQDDERCCGTGTCIIDAQGRCWCGQEWDGEKMCRPQASGADASVDDAVEVADDESPQIPDSP